MLYRQTTEGKLKESEKRDEFQDLPRELKNLCNIKVTLMPIIIVAFAIIPKELVKELGGYGNKRTNRDYSDYSIAKIDNNTEKSSLDLKRFAVTKTPVRHHQLPQV